MSKLEFIKEQFHYLIDEVDDEAVLAHYLGAISTETVSKSVELWDDVSPQEQATILEAVEQTNNPSKQISHEEAIRKHAPWRIR